MRIAVTGAGGFVGQALVEALIAPGLLLAGQPVTEVLAIDAHLPAVADPRFTRLDGDLTDPGLMARLFDRPLDGLVHLAAIPGGAVNRDPALGWRVNVGATVEILSRLAAQPKPARLVLTSSIGVFGVPLPRTRVDDETLPLPTMSYGTHKLIGEALVADYARRGLIDGLALRLPGILARPRVAGGHISAYMSDVLHALRAGEPFTCPVSAGSTSWFMSRERCVANLVHALGLPTPAPGTRRAFNLPALRLSMTELVAGAAHHFGEDVRKLVSFAPDPAVEAQFGSYPPIFTPIADSLGFRHDGSAEALVAAALGLSTVSLSREVSA